MGYQQVRCDLDAPVSSRQSSYLWGGFRRSRAVFESVCRSEESQAYAADLASTGSCPRHESNMRTRFRKPLLYPLSYGGFWLNHACLRD